MDSNTNAESSVGIEITKQMMDQSDLSDKEDEQDLDFTPFSVDWLDLHFTGCEQKLGISSLPGCRYQNTWRSQVYDIECLKAEKVEDIFCFCSKTELDHYRATLLLSRYDQAGFTVHHIPIEDGNVPDFAKILEIVEEIRLCLMGGKKTIIHCLQGLGRSCSVAACLMMVMDDNMNCDDAVKRLRDLKGPAAVYSVKQYNYVNEFEQKLKQYKLEHKGVDSRSVSR